MKRLEWIRLKTKGKGKMMSIKNLHLLARVYVGEGRNRESVVEGK